MKTATIDKCPCGWWSDNPARYSLAFHRAVHLCTKAGKELTRRKAAAQAAADDDADARAHGFVEGP